MASRCTRRLGLPLALQLLHCALPIAQTDPCAGQFGLMQLELEAKDSALARCGRLVQELRVELAALRSMLGGAGDGSGRPGAPRTPACTNARTNK